MVKPKLHGLILHVHAACANIVFQKKTEREREKDTKIQSY